MFQTHWRNAAGLHVAPFGNIFIINGSASDAGFKIAAIEPAILALDLSRGT